MYALFVPPSSMLLAELMVPLTTLPEGPWYSLVADDLSSSILKPAFKQSNIKALKHSSISSIQAFKHLKMNHSILNLQPSKGTAGK
jgi:hypothetical protein